MFLEGLSQWSRSTALMSLPPMGRSGSPPLQVPVIVSAVSRRWMPALIAASSRSSCQVSLARRSSHHLQPTLDSRIEESQGQLCLFGFPFGLGL